MFIPLEGGSRRLVGNGRRMFLTLTPLEKNMFTSKGMFLVEKLVYQL